MNGFSTFTNCNVSITNDFAFTLANPTYNFKNLNLQVRAKAITHDIANSTVCKTQTDEH